MEQPFVGGGGELNRSSVGRQAAILLILVACLILPRLAVGWLNLEMAQQALREEDYIVASWALARAAARLPGQQALWGQAGQAALKAGEFSLAQRWFEQGARLDGLTVEDWLGYGDCLFALGQTEAAAQIWQQGVRQAGPSPHLLYRLAMEDRRNGNYTAAIEKLRSALRLAPEDARLHYELGLLLTLQSPTDALSELMTALSLDPSLEVQIRPLRADLNRLSLSQDNAYRLTLIGRGLLAVGQTDLALVALERAVQTNRQYAEAWAWLAEARQQAGWEGRLQLELAFTYGSTIPSIKALDGLYWLRLGDYPKAVQAYERAVSLEPENPAWWIGLGQATEAAGLYLQARDAYQRAALLDAQSLEAWRGLARLSIVTASPEDEIGLYAVQRLIDLAPEDWRTWDLAGQLAALRWIPAEAETHFLKAIELAPEQPEPHFHLALLYLDQGSTFQAYERLKLVQELDPQGPYGWQAWRILERYFP
ncbi:MAG: tetratricopeptide repeat protein [Anaerolineales bacterium]|nr:tetratricopeptide repeat protein [Anaerolineales bacterium]